MLISLDSEEQDFKQGFKNNALIDILATSRQELWKGAICTLSNWLAYSPFKLQINVIHGI